MNIKELLSGACFTEVLIGPKGDEFHRIRNVKVLFGEDDYHTSKILDVGEKMIHTQEIQQVTPNRVRDLGGVVMTIDSEQGYTWVRRMLFHKGQIYTTDKVTGEWENEH
jgi:hypothetical protein